MYGKIVLFKRVVSVCRSQYMKKGSSKKLLEFLANMPKDKSSRILDTQRQRINIAKKYEKLGANNIYLQVLGSGARGAPNTLYLFTDQSRYLFNCGEGTQRLAHEHKVKLARLEHVFITSKTWCSIGGLPGLSLTLQDVGVPNMTLHGPEGLDELYNATKRFVIIKNMNVKMAPCSPNEDFNDKVMNVKYVLLGPDDNLLEDLENDRTPVAKRAKLDDVTANKAFEEFIHDDTDYYNKSGKNVDGDKNKTKPKSPDKDLTKTEKVLKTLQKKSNCTVAYICTFKKRFGNLDLSKCVERGLKPGPLLGKLKMGEDVVLPDGTLVLSKDVKTPDDPGPVFIVLEVPKLSYLKESEFSAHFDNGVNPPENVPAVVVHFTPPHVFHHPTYRAFMSMFGVRTRHLILNTQNSCLGSEAVHRTQHKLHLLDPDIFPLLRDVSVPAVWHAHPPLVSTESPTKLKGLEELKNKIALAQFQNIINMEGCCKGDGSIADEDPTGIKMELFAGRTLSILHLRPKREFDRSAEPKLMIQSYIKETMDMDGFAASLERFRKVVDGMRYAKNGSQKEYPKVVFLGTGSCIPSKTRNTSAIVLHIDENRSMLLDCGEGTFGQLVRFYGPKRVNAFLRTLKAVYISHLHADHHIGLIGVLLARRQALEEVTSEMNEPLHLLAPGQIVSWLCTYDMQFERIHDTFSLLPNQNLVAPHEDEPSTGNKAPTSVLSSIGLEDISTCYVSHCPNAFGVAIHVDGHKITYSGDTVPCDELVRIGMESNLLIHEATMEDELADEARVKMHSTTSQAIEMGRRMRAQYTVLTHFSQRYARLPRLNAHILHDNTSVGIAFDNMQITMSDLELLPHMYAPLQLMFAEHCMELELKAASRTARLARLSERKLQPDSNSKNANNCEVTNSVPSSLPPLYRESNASRLRQEARKTKGQPPAKRRRKRSRSGSCSSTKSANSAPPTSHNSGSSSPERPVEPTTVHNTSEACNLVIEEKSKVISKGHVINTRSKTLHSASADQSTDEVQEKKLNIGNSIVSNTSFKEVRSGYGKPLVTPIHKHAVIRKYQQQCGISSSNYDKKYTTGASSALDSCNEKLLSTPSVNRCKSPIKSWKSENRPSSTSVTSNKRDTSKIKILTDHKVDVVTSILVHLIFWRLFHLISSLSYVQWQLVVTVVSVGILFWTATKETVSANKTRWSNAGTVRPEEDRRPKSSAPYNSTKSSVLSAQQRLGVSPRRASSADRKPQDTRSLTQANAPALERNITTWNSGTKTTSTGPLRSHTAAGVRQNLRIESNIKYPALKSPDKYVEKLKTNTLNGIHAKCDIIAQSLVKLAVAEVLPTEKKVANWLDNVFSHLVTETSTNPNSKSFKPQLEDIKSSYLLLNHKNINRNINTPVNHEIKPKASMPPVDDNVRRVQLVEIKQRYKSKRFWSDSKYDKIEGLNWITWK